MSTSRGSTLQKIASTTTPRLLHTPSVPEDHDYHDSSDCPYGGRITGYDDDPAAAAYPRRCNWCIEHDRPTGPAPR
jgi:hypothetical protein